MSRRAKTTASGATLSALTGKNDGTSRNPYRDAERYGVASFDKNLLQQSRQSSDVFLILASAIRANFYLDAAWQVLDLACKASPRMIHSTGVHLESTNISKTGWALEGLHANRSRSGLNGCLMVPP